MLNSIFPITENWSWISFFLYLSVSFFTVTLCKQGLLLNAKNQCGSAYNIDRRTRAQSELCFFSAWLLLVLLATLRDDTVGTDTKNYIPYFLSKVSVDYNWSDFFSFRQQEPGFQYYIYWIRKITDNYTVLFFITYSFIAFAYIKYIKNTWSCQDNKVFLYIYIFYYVSNMSGIRSAIGAAFLILSFLCLEKKHYIKAIALTTVGVMFHYTMAFNYYIIIVHWLLNNDKLKRKRNLWIVVIICTLLFSNFGVYFLKGLFAGTKYDYYSTDLGDTSLLGSAFYILFGILCLYLYKDIATRNSVINSNLIICLGFLAVYPLLFVTSAYRIPNYYILPRLYIWSIMIDEIQKKMSSRSASLYFIGTRVAMLFFLLLRFTKSSIDGGFIYRLK